MVIETHAYTITYDDPFYDWYKEKLLNIGYKLKRSDTQTETYVKEMIYRPMRGEGDGDEID